MIVMLLARRMTYDLPPTRQKPPPHFAPVTQTAPKPGQSVNVDLGFVPANHADALKLPGSVAPPGNWW